MYSSEKHVTARMQEFMDKKHLTTEYCTVGRMSPEDAFCLYVVNLGLKASDK